MRPSISATAKRTTACAPPARAFTRLVLPWAVAGLVGVAACTTDSSTMRADMPPMSGMPATAPGSSAPAAAPAAAPTPSPASAPAAHGLRGMPSTSIAVAGLVKLPVQIDVAALKAMPASKLTIGSNVYTGVDLWWLLSEKIGLRTDPAMMNGTIALALLATGSDGYKAVLALAELDPGFGSRAALVAYDMNGAGLGRGGAIRLIVSGDSKMGRSVSNLVSIEVVPVESGMAAGR